MKSIKRNQSTVETNQRSRKKYPVKQNERPRKIRLNLTQNRFEGLEVMDIAEKPSETYKPTKQKKRQNINPINHRSKNDPVELSRIKSEYK